MSAYTHPSNLRFERTQSPQMRAASWEVREAGLPEPLWKSFAAAALLCALGWMLIVVLP